MDAASISSSSLAGVQAQASIQTFRKALDIEAAAALQLLEALPALPSSASNPTATLGRNIDTVA